MVLLIIFLFIQVSFVFRFVVKIFSVIIPPILVSGFLYYLLRPLLRWMEKFHISRTIAIILLFLLGTGFLSLLLFYSGSSISQQTVELINDFPGILEELKNNGERLIEKRQLGAEIIGRFQQRVAAIFQSIVPEISKRGLSLISKFAGLSSVFAVVPLILFYFLQDDSKFSENLKYKLAERYREQVQEILDGIDGVLSDYITGHGILALVFGVLVCFGFVIIKLPYPFILGLLLMIFSFVPTFGILIGAIPVFVVGISQNIWMLVKIFIILIIVVGIRKLLTPRLINERLEIHPLTMIFLYLISSVLFGVFGLFLAIPVYAVCIRIIEGLYWIVQIRNINDLEPRKEFGFFRKWARKLSRSKLIFL